ncbi:MAG: gliding motility-associated C-terminal domain-containing protein [Flavobacteriia bacterium]|nr:gliding motility-associated C-terminal domain-containing protein [Flavobacteriia bacterium]
MLNRYIFSLLISCVMTGMSYSQMQATFTKTINTKCNGADCDYSGPSILINEIMASPTNNDGCLSGTGGSGQCKGEWIELYNPDLCQPIDISCYYLGATTPGTFSSDREAFLIPSGTVVPPGGFCLIRGENAPAVPSNRLVQNGGNVVEIVMPGAINGDGMCVQSGGGVIPSTPTRFWFPNASGGWFAFYDRNGVPQDCVYWGSGTITGQPCVPTRTGCNNSVTSLSDFAGIPANRKTQILNSAIPDGWGKSFKRVPDGGSWEAVPNTSSYVGTPTPGNCNGTCATVGSSSCDGTATVNVTGGTAPYTYLWNDSQAQLTQTATGLCAGSYQVRVTDNTGAVQYFQVMIENHVPAVSFTIIENVCNEGQTIPITTYSPVPASGQTGAFTGTGISGTSFNVAASGNGQFPLTYTFTDENGCTNFAKDTINVHPKPQPVISGIAPTYCLSNVIVTPTLTPAGGVLSGPGVSNGTFSVLAAGVGNHTIKYVVTTAAGCSDSTQITVTISGSTPPTFTIQDEICLNAAPIPLSGTPAGGTFTINGQTITQFNPSVYGLGQHIIAYTISDPSNPQCMAQATDTIKVVDGVTITANVPKYFCFHSPNQPIDIQPAGGQLSGTLVSGNELTISTAQPGNYSFTYDYTTSDGCSSSYTHNFTVGPEVAVAFTFSQDCFQNVTLTAKPVVGTFADYRWYQGTTSLGSGSAYGSHVETPGEYTYSLEATNVYGCKAYYSEQIFVNEGVKPENFVIPNVLTPNNDNKNDFITMPMMDNDCIVYKVLILNRWGNLVYEATQANPVFAGKDMNGHSLSDGVYFYKIVSDDFDCDSDEYKPMCYGFITIVSK